MQDVAGHITQCTCAVIPPSTPVPGRVDLVEVIHNGRTGEKIPVQSVGYGLLFAGYIEALGPDGTVGEGFYLCYFSNFTIEYPFCNQVYTLA